MFVVDIHGFSDRHHPAPDAFRDLNALCAELSKYDPKWMKDRRCLLAVNKMDTPGALERLTALSQQIAAAQAAKLLPAMPLLPISAAHGDGLPVLARQLRRAVDSAKTLTEVRDVEIEPSGAPYVSPEVLASWQGSSASRSRVRPKSRRQKFMEYLLGADMDMLQRS